MRRLRVPETIGAAFTASLTTLAVLAAPVAGPSPADAARAADEPVDQVLLDSDFEDGSAGRWVGRGDATVTVVDGDAHAGAHALDVAGRTASWHGAQANILDLVVPGGTYTVTGWVKLSGPGQTTVKFSVAETPEAYTQVNAPVTVGDAEWVELSGTYTVPAGLTGAALYVEATDPTASFLLDDVTVVGPPAAPGDAVAPGGAVDPTTSQVTTARGTGDVVALTFDDGPNPGETEALLDLLAGTGLHAVFCVIGQNIEAPGGAEILQRIVAEGHTLCNHSTSYADMGSWSPEQVEADLTANLRIIRDALGDPTAPVPYFRAPNGSWGQTPQVAVDLGMQPLGLGNVIFDWDGNDLSVETLTANLRAAVVPGAVVLAHDGGGDRSNTIAAFETVLPELLAAGWQFTLPAERGPEAGAGAPTVVASLDFDDQSYDPWTTSGNPTLAYVDDGAGGKALSITRAADYEGIQSPVGLLEAGTVYTFSMRARLPEGTAGDADLRFVVKPAYTWVANTTVTGNGWTEVTGEFTVPGDVVPTETQVYLGTEDLGAPYTVLVDDVLITKPSGGGSGAVVDLTFDFEDGLQGWVPRGDEQGDPTVATTTTEAHGGTQAALVSDRTSQGDGIRYDVTQVFEIGATYDITAWVKMAAGETADDLWLSVQRVNDGANSFDTVGQFTGITSGQWHQVTAAYTMASADTAWLYFETSYNTGGAGSFLVDDVTIRSQDPREIQEVTPIKDTVDFPVGVAIDSRETIGAPAELTLRHFDQITPENHMKVEAWYDADHTFGIHPEAVELMNFAQRNDLRLYGHVLVWHSQTPDWFFTDDAGQPLTTSEADKQLMRDRMRTHIFDVAQTLAEGWGPFGSDTNPLVAWDVVNEVVADSGEFADGLRRSEWYRILGEEFIDLAFTYADEAFNQVYAAEGTDRPVALFINDYNTEQNGKQNRYRALVERMLDRGVPLDGVGHQFHVSLSTPVASLDAALDRFADLPVEQAVTELDVTVGTPVTQANLVEQGYYYRDAFRVFREHTDQLFSVTAWGLTDNRSWRSEQAPLVFDGQLQAKPAYDGVVDGDGPPRLLSELVFQGDVPLADAATSATEWLTLPLHRVEDVAQFQLRWQPDHLTAYVQVTDASDQATDGVTFVLGDQEHTLARDGSGDVQGVVTETPSGWTAVAHLPLTGAEQGQTLQLDVRVSDGGTVTGWASEGSTGGVTLVEPLSYVEVAEAPTVPTIDGEADEAWALAQVVSTDKQIEGQGGATAEVRTLWSGDGSTLYVLADVTDPQLDATGSDPWVQDSVEIFLDAGNVRNGPYRYDDTQIRISYLNVTSFGTGDEAFQQNRLTSATTVTDTGYRVEAAISLLESGGPGTFHGLDFQVNDGTDGARTAVRTWADPTGLGYQSTARWGVARLVEAPVVEPPVIDPAVTLDRHVVAMGGTLEVGLTGYAPGSTVEVRLADAVGRLLGRPAPGHGNGRDRSVLLGTVTVDGTGSGSSTATVPRGTRPGLYDVVATSGEVGAAETVLVTPPVPPTSHRWPAGSPR